MKMINSKCPKCNAVVYKEVATGIIKDFIRHNFKTGLPEYKLHKCKFKKCIYCGRIKAVDTGAFKIGIYKYYKCLACGGNFTK